MARRLPVWRSKWQGSLVLAAALVVPCAGCTSTGKTVEAWLDRWPFGLTAPSARGDEQAVERVAARIAHDGWKENAAWTPLVEAWPLAVQPARPARTRWLLPECDEMLNAAVEEGLLGVGARAQFCCAAADAQIAQTGELNALFARLARRDDLAGWNAAMIWVHHDPVSAGPKVAKRLEQIATGKWAGARAGRAVVADDSAVGTEISVRLRAAAAEAWCLALAAAGPGDQERFAPVVRALERDDLPAQVADELLRGAARRVLPNALPRLAEWLAPAGEAVAGQASANRALRRWVAVEACVLHAVHHREETSPAASSKQPEADDAAALEEAAGPQSIWPPALWNCRHDPDPRVRRRFCEFLAAASHPAAELVLNKALEDVDGLVRDHVPICLGVLGTREAAATLERELSRPEERRRMMAVRGAAFLGEKMLSPRLQDPSAKVRAEVVMALGRMPGPVARELIGRCAADKFVEVQTACVGSIKDWPAHLAEPVLLEVLTDGSLRARKAALAQLEERRDGALSFPVHAGMRERALRVQRLMEELRIPDRMGERLRLLAHSDDAANTTARLHDLREFLAQRGAFAEDSGATPAAEVQLAPSDVPLLEKLLEEADSRIQTWLFSEVLPTLSPAHQALVQLESADVKQRRAAAQTLARLGEESSLSAAVTGRLAELMKPENDGAVWRSAMRAVWADRSEEGGALALLAVNHAWPDVRVLGCEYIGQHGEFHQAPWLVALFHDANKSVQLAAVTAAGACKNPVVLEDLAGEGGAVRQGLRSLLPNSTGALRAAVVLSMCQLGDQLALEELTRMARDPNAALRRQALVMMGRTGQSRFISVIVQLVWTESDAMARQAALESLAALVPASERPAGLARSRDAAHAVEIWTNWWQDRQHDRAAARHVTHQGA